MATLNTLRTKGGVIVSIVIGIALLAFLLGDLSSANGMLTSRKMRVGEINGTHIGYLEYTNLVDHLTAIQQAMSGKDALSNEEQEQVREMAWDQLVNEYALNPGFQDMGIVVSEAEQIDMVDGAYISPVINSVFTNPNTGLFDPTLLRNFVSGMSQDASGRAAMIWNYLKEQMNRQREMSKYVDLVGKGMFVTDLEVEQAVANANTSSSISYIQRNYDLIADSLVEVSESEVRDYYAKHQRLFRQTATRDIEYVVFEVKPSQTDIADANDKVVKAYDEFSTTDNVKNFLMKNSDTPYSDEWYKKGELRTVSADVENFVFDSKTRTGDVSQVLAKDNTFYVARVMDSAMVPDSVFVKGILLQGVQTDLADSLLNVLKTGKDNFENVAAQYSAMGASQTGEPGDYGWMTKNTMFPGIESVFTARLNNLYVVETQYGKHILKVTDRSEPLQKKKVAIFEKEALPSGNTINEYYVQANALATKADGKYENLKKVVDEEGLALLTRNNLREGDENVGSVNDRTKEISKWAFETKREGKVSNVLNINNDYYVVAALKKIHKDGYAPVADVASSISSIIYNQKLGEKKAAEVAGKIEGLGSMEAIAEALGTTVSTREGISFSSYMNQGLDPKFIGAVSVAEEGVISAPLAGNIGVYVYKVVSHDEGSSFTEEDVKNRAAQMSYYASQSLLPVMMQDADVEDNRARFF